MPHTRASDATHQRIIQAALDCFSRKGYNSTTMDEIATASGTSKGTLYWHFESKEDLLASAFRSFFDAAFGGETLVALEMAPTAAGKVRLLAERMAQLTQGAEGLFNLFLEYWASSHHRETAAALWLDLLSEYRGIVISVLEMGVERGEFGPVDARALSWALLAAYDGLAAYAMLEPDLDLLRVHSAFIEVVLRGLEAEP